MKLKCFLHSNFGDEPLNRYLYEHITLKKADIISFHIVPNEFNFLMCGSILSKADKRSLVWGSGFITQNQLLQHTPYRIYAVRGKHSWQQLESQKIIAPYIFGDPGLLLPKFYNPIIEKKYKLGIIPHYTEQESPALEYYKNIPEVCFINICDGVENVVNQMLQCENIASSSLHGLIVADAYKIPNIWIGISNKIQGVGYKYFDYYSITDKNPIVKYNLHRKISYKDLVKSSSVSTFNVDLDKFWEVCPLRREDEFKMG